MVTLKYGERGFAPCIYLRIPFPTLSDTVYKLLRKLGASTSCTDAYLFPCRSRSGTITDADLRSSLDARVADVCPPAGNKFTARSLRSGGISAAYTVGVRLETIMRLSNHTLSEVVHRHYLDALLPDTPFARVFLSALRPLLTVCYPPASLDTGNSFARGHLLRTSINLITL